ncbi:MAG: glycosyltransferase family 2 protein [Marivita sp.]|uniref:glycosyltransferase family 2 protein n=1 Tax=Marivita sp. TaxID=2003365 RepID=UPI0025B7D189|nr:glycosyltransferase family 2 protein [Marivita sp.]MCI5111050.1 glycosyltransferase family 2 protein [Marivita sp.]
MTITAVLCVRNEAAFLLDWLAWHRSVGITDFVVVSNECDDGTDAMLDRLEALGWLTHLRNAPPYGNGGIQFSGLKLAGKAEAVQQADWLIALDIDEFVNVHVGDRTLPALITALPEATAITLTWRNFGNAGVMSYEDAPVPLQFTRAGPRPLHWPWRAAMFKTLYRNDRTYRNLGVHRPRNPVEDRLAHARWFDGDGRALPPEMATGRIFSDYRVPQHGLVQLNHYPLGAMESYVLKADRGRAVHSDDRLGLDYWVERNLNTEEDRSALDLWDRAQPIRSKLSADPVLAQLHGDAVEWRKSRFQQLLTQDAFRDLFGRLLMTPPSCPLSSDAANALIAHAQGAVTDDAAGS